MAPRPPLSEAVRNLAAADVPAEHAIERVLAATRAHLGMEVAFVAEFRDGLRVFRFVDADSGSTVVEPGTGGPLEESYCQRVVDGRLPEVIPDTALVPAASKLPLTHELPVRSHISVPIRLSDGRVYGTFCCFSRQPEPSLRERDAAFMRMVAELVADQLEREEAAHRRRREAVARIRAVLATGPAIALQPIVELDTGRTAGYEALARFRAEPRRPPDAWFEEAVTAGLGLELELTALREALRQLERLPPQVYLSVNVSPASLIAPALLEELRSAPLERVVLELTEHARVESYLELRAVLDDLGRYGARLAVDDAGAGFSSFGHILSLAPEFIKLDVSLTRDIAADPARQAMAAALSWFAEDQGMTLVAEGIESPEQLEALRSFGVRYGQGRYLGQPRPPSDRPSGADRAA